ncbi:MAG TPA: (2Fe-2S) ferredoxin domain-containing protein [Thermoleophilia bacterium]|nr:(2Fe-2S) ferredoxin domain-containing protein [Thermoleophilia bacterium]
MTEKIKSAADLKAFADRAKAAVELREGTKDVQVTVHMGTCGIAAGARGVIAAFMREMSAAGVTDVTLRQSGCAGLCEQEPMITVRDASDTPYRYGLLDDAKVKTIVTEHLVGGQPVDALLIGS